MKLKPTLVSRDKGESVFDCLICVIPSGSEDENVRRRLTKKQVNQGIRLDKAYDIGIGSTTATAQDRNSQEIGATALANIWLY